MSGLFCLTDFARSAARYCHALMHAANEQAIVGNDE